MTKEGKRERTEEALCFFDKSCSFRATLSFCFFCLLCLFV